MKIEFVWKRGLDIYNTVGFSSDKSQYNGGKEEPKQIKGNQTDAKLDLNSKSFMQLKNCDY